jgi:hypothetical protein
VPSLLDTWTEYCDTLLDIDKKDGRFFYQFKNLRVNSKVEPFKLCEHYGYRKENVKTAPIVSEVKKKILGSILLVFLIKKH